MELKIKKEKIKFFARKILNLVWEKTFLVLIIFLFFDFLLAGILALKYLSSKEISQGEFYLPLTINKALLDEFSQRMSQQESELLKIKQESVREIFR